MWGSMAAQLKASRVLLWSLAIFAAAGTYGWLSVGQPAPEPVREPFACEPPPPNVKRLGPPLTAQQASEVLATYSPDFLRLRDPMRAGDTVHEFETAVTGGHLVMRGNCFVGQAVAWIR